MRIKVPTTLSDERNELFRKMYMDHFGMELSIEEANEEANRLMTFIAVIIECTPKFWDKSSESYE